MKLHRSLLACLYGALAANAAATPEARGGKPKPSALDAACQAALKALGEAVVDLIPLDPETVAENWSQSCIQESHCIISPTTAKQVSQAVKIISKHGVKFATRSGGHSPNPGWSSIDSSGVLIDMSRFDDIKLSADKKVASVGPGLRWGEITPVLEAQGVYVVGGRLPDVGVGGLILGGGYHHTSGKNGLAADNVKAFEVVLADGSIKTASASQNSDLFWALKGGGPNFGIVTRYDLNTFPSETLWCQMNVYSVDQAPAVLDAFTAWQKGGASDLESTVALIVSLDAVTVGFLYFEAAVQPEAFKPFYDLEPLQVAIPPTNASFGFLDQVLGGAFPSTPARHDYRGVSSRIDANTTKEVYEFWVEKAVAMREATGANQTFAIQHIPTNLVEQGISKGGNALGVPKEDHLWWTTIVDWDDSADDDTVRSVSIDTTEYWTKVGEERGLHIPFLFMNDASRDQSPISTYSTGNIRKLKAVAKKYDPRGFFQKQQHNGFLLSKL